jgi:hypothetical protein
MWRIKRQEKSLLGTNYIYSCIWIDASGAVRGCPPRIRMRRKWSCGAMRPTRVCRNFLAGYAAARFLPAHRCSLADSSCQGPKDGAENKVNTVLACCMNLIRVLVPLAGATDDGVTRPRRTTNPPCMWARRSPLSSRLAPAVKDKAKMMG